MPLINLRTNLKTTSDYTSTDPSLSYGKINPHQTINEKYTELLKKKLKRKRREENPQ